MIVILRMRLPTDIDKGSACSREAKRSKRKYGGSVGRSAERVKGLGRRWPGCRRGRRRSQWTRFVPQVFPGALAVRLVSCDADAAFLAALNAGFSRAKREVHAL